MWPYCISLLFVELTCSTTTLPHTEILHDFSDSFKNFSMLQNTTHKPSVVHGGSKNHQFYFSKCFLDVFVLKSENVYYVNFVETRSIKLNGKLNKDECLQDIYKRLAF